MIRRDKGEIIFECDECGADFPGGTAEFYEVLQDLKAAGWRIRKVEDEDDGETTWEHYCADCCSRP